MKKTKLYAKKTLSVFMAVMMLMSAWVFVPGEHNHASAVSAATISATNRNAVSSFTDASFNTGFTTVSGNFHGDNATTMASRGYYKNVLYSPHFPASNNNLNNSDAGVYFGNLGNTADGARVWYPETTLIWDGSTTPQIPILFDIDSNNNNRVGVKNVYISSGANGLTFKDSYWTAKSECGKDTNYYTHFTFDWIMQNNSGNYWISTSSGNDKESMCSSKGYWDIYGTYLQYTGGSFGSGSTYYKTITPTWVCRTGSNYTGTTNKTIYVIDYVPLKNALDNVKTLINEVKSNPAKYTTASVSALVDAANELINAKPNNYINSSVNGVYNWNSAVSSALSAYNSAKNLVIQKYTVTFKTIDNVEYVHTYDYGTSINCTTLSAGHKNTIKQLNDQSHQKYAWDATQFVSTVTDDIMIAEVASGTEGHTWGDCTINDTTHSWTCSVCGYVKTQDHVRDNGTITKEDTCTEAGTKTYDCSICGKEAIATETVDIIKNHSFTGDWTDKGDGKHYQKCIRCDAYGLGTTEGDCEAHTWNNGVVITPADCTTDGEREYSCTKCDATYTAVIPATGHPTDKITATAAKDVTTICGGDGNQAFWTCGVCKKIYTDSACETEVADYKDEDNDGIPDILETKGPEHKFTGNYVSVSPGADGKHHRQCERFTVCGAYGPEEDHTYEKVTTPSTCKEAGKVVYTCSLCSQSYTETLPLAKHTLTKVEAKAADCYNPGNNEYYKCEVCSKCFKDEEGLTETTAADEVVPKLGHTFANLETDIKDIENDKLVSAATCMKPAVYRVTCDICGYEKEGNNTTYEYGDPDTVNGHMFNGAEVQQNADGTHSYKCTVEGCTAYGNPTKCNYEITADVASTCKTAGYTTYTCKDCLNGYTDIKGIDANNHTGEGTYLIASQPSTCHTNGSTGVEKCSGCNATLSTKLNDLPLDPDNHENMQNFDAKEATCQTEGYEAYSYCSACQNYGIAKKVIEKKAHKFTSYTTNNDGTHKAVCDTCDEAVAEKAVDVQDCYGGKANCVDKKVCTVCNTAYGEVDSTNHKNSVLVAKVLPTCQKEGSEPYRKCTECNTNITEPVAIAKEAHVYGAWSKVDGKDEHSRSCITCDEAVAPAATETEACKGGTAYCNEKAKCSECKAAYGTFNAENHKSQVNTLKDVIPATCQSKGFSGNYRYNCCDVIKTAGTETEMLAHTFDIEVEGTRKAATCIAKGEVTYKCSTCVESEDVVAATYKEEIDINANNHASKETVTVNYKAATCEEDGNTGDVYHKCCYDSEKTDAENRKALIQKGRVIKAEGQHVYTTAVPEYMLELDADGNPVIIETKDAEGNVVSKAFDLKANAPDYDAKVDARRDDNKWYHVQLCEICDKITYTACYTYEHTYNCADTDECEVCNGLCSLRDADKHKADLVEVKDDAKPATCTEDGVKSYYECIGCGKTYFDADGKNPFNPDSEEDKAALVIDKSTATHAIDWNKPAETVEGNCGQEGYKLYICSVCKEEVKLSTGAVSNNHTWAEDYTVTDEPTCSKNGYKAIKCKVCGKVKPNSYVIVPATGEHDYDRNKDGIVNSADAFVTEGKNCQEPGTLTYNCQNDGCDNVKVETDTSGVSAHKFGAWIAIGGDCSTGVAQKRTCSVCGVSEQRNVSTDAHQYKTLIRVEPTTEEDGYEIRKCENCGIEDRVSIPRNPDAGEGDEGNEGEEAPESKHQFNYERYRVVKEASCKSAEIREYTCLLCGEKVRMPYGDIKDHVWLKQSAEKPTCEKGGHNAYYKCVRCEETLGYKGENEDEQYKPLGHNDANSDGECDRCGAYCYGDGAEICTCMCHSKGLMGIIYKIVRIFWKLFKINHECGCGVAHY